MVSTKRKATIYSMATPIAHSLLGLTLYLLFTQSPLKKEEWRWLAFAILFSCAPDLDFIPGALFGDMNTFHRGFSHSVGGCFIFSLLFCILLKKRCDFTTFKFFCFLMALYGSHLIVDFFTRDTWAPHGAQFLRPFSEAFFKSPVDLFLDANRTPWTKAFSLHNLITYFSELLIFGLPLFYLSKKMRQKKRLKGKTAL